MVASFLSVAAIAHRTYVQVVKNEPFTDRQAYVIIAIIYLIAVFGTIISGLFSPTYLVESGTFCFFDWSSHALTNFAWPVALIAGICMIYWYYQTFKRVREIQHDAQHFVREHEPSRITGNVAKRLTFLVLLFFCSYATIMSLSFYELSGRRAGSYYDILSATTALIYWVAAPISYAHINKRLGFQSVLCLPGCLPLLDPIFKKIKETSFYSNKRTSPSTLRGMVSPKSTSTMESLDLSPISPSLAEMNVFVVDGYTGVERTEGPRSQGNDPVFPIEDRDSQGFLQSPIQIELSDDTLRNTQDRPRLPSQESQDSEDLYVS